MVGPPGTGKTMLARAAANAAKVPVFATTGTDLVDWSAQFSLGERTRRLFAAARLKSPSIIFIDEFDAIAGQPTVAKLLGSEMDGFSSSENVLVIAAANSLERVPASMLRPGRFDRIVQVRLPTEPVRQEILRRASRSAAQSDCVGFGLLARLTENFSGADLVKMARLAIRQAADAEKVAVEEEDWEAAFDEVTLGPVDDDLVGREHQRFRIAVHEAGHALMAILIDGPWRLQRATMVPRGEVLGHTRVMPPLETMVELDESALRTMLAIALAGQAAEQLTFRSFGTGAGSDMQKATALARQMVTAFGMSERIGSVDRTNVNDALLSLTAAETTKAAIDAEISRLVGEQKDRALQLLADHQPALLRTANELSAKSTLTEIQIRALLAEGSDP